MTFKLEDWTDRLKGLEEVSQLILKHRETKDRSHLSLAIWHLWRFAEYAVNAGLELIGARTDRGHQLDRSAEELGAKGILQSDYSDALRQLEIFRKKVDYGSYSREKSAHYNATNVEKLLTQLQSLQAELGVHLRKAKKIQ